MKARKVKGLDPDGTFADNTERIVETRLSELRSFAPKALERDGEKALHDMRIAAKRLRYVLELARPALGPSAATGARTAKRLQDVLGEIHDCDVMLPRVRRQLKALRAEDAEQVRFFARRSASDLEPQAAAAAPNLDRYRGLEALRAYLVARREVLFERFARDWKRIEGRGFADELLASLRPPEGPPEPEARRDGAAP